MKKSSGRNHVEDLLGPYLDAELDDKARARVEQHLKECAECRRELESLQALHQMVKQKDTGPELADDYWDWHRSQVWKKVRLARRERRQRSWYGGRFMWLRLATVTAGAAVVVIAVFAGWRILVHGRPDAQRLLMTEAADKEGKTLDLDGMEVSAADEVEETPGTGGIAARRGMESRVSGKAHKAEEAAPVTGYLEDREAEGETRVSGGVGKARAKKGPAPAPEIATAEPAPAEAERLSETEVSRADKLAPAKPESRQAPGQERIYWALGAGEKKDSFAAVDAAACDQTPELLEVPALPLVEPQDTATVLVRALVDTDGSVFKTEVERSSGVELLDTVAVDNFRQARFRPAQQQGRLVRCWVEVEQRFRPDADLVAPEEEQPGPEDSRTTEPEDQPESEKDSPEEPGSGDPE
jgi:TonB family protein